MQFSARFIAFSLVPLLSAAVTSAQMIDNTQAEPTLKAGINKSLPAEIGAGRGNAMTPDSSIFIIQRDPFRSVRRGRQLFQRKFTRLQGQGPNEQDGVASGGSTINTDLGIGAGLADSCALCHGRPRGSAGAGGDVVTRPDSRDAPHLFGLGIKEMLADEITTDLRAVRDQAIADAIKKQRPVKKPLVGKGINYGFITGNPDGSADTSQVNGIDPDLRVKPFFAEGSTYLMVLDGTKDKISAPPASDVQNGIEVDPAIVDHLEFYLLNYFKPGHDAQNASTGHGRQVFASIGCASCHVQSLTINHDRRVADVETVSDTTKGIFNSLFATATPLVQTVNDNSVYPPLKLPAGNSFTVNDIFTDFKRHDLGPNFYERNWDGTLQKQFLTRPLWGVGSTGPYGHDGRSMTLDNVILRHGGESLASRNAYAALSGSDSDALLKFLNSLILFPPDDTASNLDPGNPSAPNFPQVGHGSIKLTVLFNDPADPE